MSVPDRGNHPNRRPFFTCQDCGKTTPIHEAGVDMVCNNCFDDRYALDGGFYECTHVKADDSGMCDYVAKGNTKAQRRNDLDRHFDEDPEHNGDPDSRYNDEDEASRFHSSYAPSFIDDEDLYGPAEEEEDAYWANKDNDIKDIRNPGSNEKGEQKWQ